MGEMVSTKYHIILQIRKFAVQKEYVNTQYSENYLFKFFGACSILILTI
jgi:hypothetical protein